MKKKISILILLLMMVSILSSCSLINGLIIRTSSNPAASTTTQSVPSTTSGKPGSTSVTSTSVTSALPSGNYYVTYEYNNGVKETVTSTGNVNKPTNPTKNYAKFLYWCSDEELEHEFNFSKKIDSDTTLYAKYEVNYRDLTNAISTSVIKANVQINHTNQRSPFSTGQKSIGSGIIISENSSYYFVLTNNHVIYPEGNASIEYSTYTVEDCYGQTYENVTCLYRDVNYDLAILGVKKQSFSKLPTKVALANDIYVNEEIIALGEPHGQSNTITYGNVKEWYPFKADIETKTQSNVNFDVISHTAKIESGSSGGALLDTNFNLVGINFASGSSKSGVEYSYAIPIYKVREFLKDAESETGKIIA